MDWYMNTCQSKKTWLVLGSRLKKDHKFYLTWNGLNFKAFICSGSYLSYWAMISNPLVVLDFMILKKSQARQHWSFKFSKPPPEVYCKKGVLNFFANFTGKHLCWSLFLIKLQAFSPVHLLKRDSNEGVFL